MVLKHTVGLCILLFCTVSFPVLGQEQAVRDSTRYLLSLVNGERFVGFVLERRNDSLYFQTLGGTTVIAPIERVFDLERTTELHDSMRVEKRRSLPKIPDQPANSLFLMPTACTIPAGEVHAGLYEIFVPGLSVGLGGFADFSFATLIPGFTEVYMLSAKLSPLQTEAGALALGGVVAGTYEEDDPITLLYAVGTLALGQSWLSMGYTAFNLSEDGEGLVMLGFDAPVASRSRVIAELWIPVQNGASTIAGVGGRFESRQFWLDIGLYFPLTDQSGYGSFTRQPTWFPYLGGTFIF
jgi:hypothetical protein